jgi:hypothetical protein
MFRLRLKSLMIHSACIAYLKRRGLLGLGKRDFFIVDRRALVYAKILG